jgi:metal-responsive CopG/Arc/MetJ family transcriptional regulator
MSMAETRTHVVLPTELVERVDRLVGSRRRSRFFAAAVAKEVERLELLAVAREAAGSLAAVAIPGWETSESIAEWVHALRQEDVEQLDDSDRQSGHGSS